MVRLKSLNCKQTALKDQLIKKIILMVGIIAVLGVASSSVVISSSASAQTSLSVADFDQSNSNEFVPGQIVVGLKKPDPNFHANVAALGGQVINTINEINAFVVKVPQNAENGFISAMSKNPNVKYAERDAIVTALFPNDQYYGIQWGMPRIGMDSVWVNENDRELGSGVIVAVVDTGIYDNHDDLDGARILTDIDWDFVDDDDDTRPNKICRQFGQSSAEWHATFVAGIIGATTNNVIGVAGVGPVDILPVRTLNQCGSGFSSDVAAGILHAKNNGAHVINLSLGSSAASNSILDAVNLAYAADIILVAAAGNDGDQSISYPAGFDNVISVSATTNIDELASYSQFGNTIELSAPGGSSGSCSTSGTPYIVSTGAIVSGRNVILTYLCAIGTSFASPHVAGVAALLKTQYMSDSTVSNVDIRTHLQTTAEDLGAEGKDIKFGYGLVRADVAVSTSIGASLDPDITPPVITPNPITDPFEITLTDQYIESCTATDDDPNYVDNCGVLVGGIDTSVLGLQSVTYTADPDPTGNEPSDVVVSTTVQDTTAPTITLNGATPVTLVQNVDTYTELGASVSDNNKATTTTATVGGDIVDVTTVGTYIVEYTATDPSLNPATPVTRTVNVVAATSDDVVITKADFHIRKSNLHVQATSTDPSATLSVYDEFGVFIDVMKSKSDGSYQLKINVDPGNTITVKSTSGGSDTAPVNRR